MTPEAPNVGEGDYEVQLVINLNLKTAKALGLTIPPSLLARAAQTHFRQFDRGSATVI